jgi:hypothetical protein
MNASFEYMKENEPKTDKLRVILKEHNMQINVKEFLAEAGITEAFYPGKRLVHKMRQTGEFKSHCVVLDWRNPDKIRIEIKAGLSGQTLEPKKLKYYPVCFQSPTYVDVEIVNDNSDEETEEGKSSSGKGGSGGKKPKKSLQEMSNSAMSAFGSAIEGIIPEAGKIVEMVVLGKEIAKEAYGKVMAGLAHQIEHMKISATDLLAQASNMVTRYTPPSFMQPTGDEQATYKYDREKNADIGFKQTLG